MPTPDLLTPPVTGDAEAILAASADVRSFCGWHIAPSFEETITVDGSGRFSLLIPSLLVQSVASVVEDGVLIPDTDYDWSAAGIIERRSGVWTNRRRGVVVTLTHGYDTCPLEVARVVTRSAKDGMTPDRLTSWRAGPFAKNYATDAAPGEIDSYAERILNRYALPRLA